MKKRCTGDGESSREHWCPGSESHFQAPFLCPPSYNCHVAFVPYSYTMVRQEISQALGPQGNAGWWENRSHSAVRGARQSFLTCLLGGCNDGARLSSRDKVHAQQRFGHQHPQSTCLPYEANGANCLTSPLSGGVQWFWRKNVLQKAWALQSNTPG